MDLVQDFSMQASRD